MAKTLNDLLAQASEIRTEQDAGDNSAERVGKMLEDIINYIGQYQGSDSGSGGSGSGGGGGDIDWAQLNAAFLNANNADTANGKITFNGGFESHGVTEIYHDSSGEPALWIHGNENSDSTPLQVDGVDMDGLSISVVGGISAGTGFSSPNGKVTAKEVEVGNPRTNNGTLTVNGDSNISGKLTVQDLQVNGSATFMELLINQMRAQKGAMIITAANCVIDAHENLSPIHYIYFKTKNNRANDPQCFVAGDLVVCMDFNDAHIGTMSQVSNKYYWFKVASASSTPTKYKLDAEGTATSTQIDDEGNYYHWISFDEDAVGSYLGDDIPNFEEGDELVQLGYNGNSLSGNSLKAHQSAIILSSYSTPDQDLQPPFLAFYENINTYALSPFRKTYRDATGIYINGAFIINSSLDSETSSISVESYTLIPQENPITAPASGNTKTISFKVLHTLNGAGKFVNRVDIDTNTEMSMTVAIAGTSTRTVTLDGRDFEDGCFKLTDIRDSDQSIDAKLYFTSGQEQPILKDQYVANIIHLDNINNGINGDKIERVYKKVQIGDSTGDLPDQGKSWADTDNKNGWAPWDSETHRDEVGYYLYYISRAITFDSANHPQYGDWQGPFRTTGQKGDPGEPGQTGDDGAGFKNIFAKFPSAPSAAPIFTGGYPESSTSMRDDTTNVLWYDVPISPTSTQNVYISQSTTFTGSGSNRVWDNFSLPALFSLYSKGAVQHKLIALQEAFEVVITPDNTGRYEEISGSLSVNLAYQMAVITGDGVSYPTDLSGYAIKIVHNGTSGNGYTQNTIGTAANPIPAIVGSGNITYVNANLLVTIEAQVNGVSKTNYYELVEGGYTTYLPSSLTVSLYKDSDVVDTRVVKFVFKADSVFSVTKAALTSIYQGMGGTGEYGYTSFQQNWQGVTTRVTSVETGLRNTNTNVTTLRTRADGIEATVENQNNSIDSLNTSVSNITQKSDRLSLEVKESGMSENLLENWDFGTSFGDESTSIQMLDHWERASAPNGLEEFVYPIKEGTLHNSYHCMKFKNSFGLPGSEPTKTMLQYALYRSSSSMAPSAPIGDVSNTSDDVTGTWTTNRSLAPNSNYPYVYLSRRKKDEYGNWSNWLSPVILYKQYGNTSLFPGKVMQLGLRQKLSATSILLPKGTRIISSAWVYVAETAGAKDVRIGMEMIEDINSTGVYDGIVSTACHYQSEGGAITEVSLTNNQNNDSTNTTRRYMQAPNLPSGWSRLIIEWGTQHDMDLSNLTFGLHTYHKENLSDDQPDIYFSEPSVTADIKVSKAGINIAKGEIHLEGVTTVNDGFMIDTDGWMSAKGGLFSGFVRTLPTIIDSNTIGEMYTGRTSDVIWPWLKLSGDGTYYLGATASETLPVLNLRKSGNAVVFKGTISPGLIHLPFIANGYTTKSGVSSQGFAQAYLANNTHIDSSTIVNGDSDHTVSQMYLEIARVRTYVGCFFEVYNVTNNNGSINLVGVKEGTMTSSDEQDIWDNYTLPNGYGLRLECKRLTLSDTWSAANQSIPEVIYWEVVNKFKGLTPSMFDDVTEENLRKI